MDKYIFKYTFIYKFLNISVQNTNIYEHIMYDTRKEI